MGRLAQTIVTARGAAPKASGAFRAHGSGIGARRCAGRLAAAVLAAALAVSWSASARAQRRPARVPRAEKNLIDRAIDDGVKYLKSTQNPDGTWQGQYGNRLGGIALAGLALRESGVPQEEPVIQRALGRVRTLAANDYNTYDVALSIMFLDRITRDKPSGTALRSAIGTPKVKKLKSGRVLVGEQVADSELIADLGDRLLSGQGPGGAWNYNLRTAADGDHSNTQFGVLGLWVAGQHGQDVGEGLERCDKHFRNCQSREGGWGYGNSGQTPPMTCAGLIALAAGLGHQRELTAGDARSLARNPAPEKDPKIEAGFRRLDAYLKSDLQTRVYGSNLYFVWSVERVGVLYGTEKIGQVAWYDWAASRMVGKQAAAPQAGNGSWNAHGTLVGTSFALLVLNRANVSPELTKALGGNSGDGEQGIRAVGPGEGPSGGGPTAALSDRSVADLLAMLQSATAKDDRQAISRELSRRRPSFADVKDDISKILGYTQSKDGDVAAAARAQVANAAQRASIEHPLHWIAWCDDDLRKLVLEQIDGRIDRADADTKSTYRRIAVAVLGHDGYKTASREAALEVLAELGDRRAVKEVADVLLELPSELWPAAGRTLHDLTGDDYGPKSGDGIGEVVEAKKKWQDWLHEQGDP